MSDTTPRLGDTDNDLLFKICQLVGMGGGGGGAGVGRLTDPDGPRGGAPIGIFHQGPHSSDSDGSSGGIMRGTLLK